MSGVYLLEPDPSAAWFPFADARPVCELRAGAWLIRERWEAIADGEVRQIVGPEHLHGFVEEGVPPVGPLPSIEGPVYIGRSEFAPTGVRPALSGAPARLVHQDEVVGWWVPEGTAWTGPADHEAWEPIEVDGVLFTATFDTITALEHFLKADTEDFTQEGGGELPTGSTVIGDPHDVVIMTQAVEPGVIFDVRQGPVVLEQHVYVKGGTRFEGPVYVGPGTQILGGEIKESAFGPRCKVRGEVLASVFLGYANKAHDGFLGHSVVGRWVNLGAGTVTSNLKNTYGEVALDVRGHTLTTGRQYLGSLIGDHAKTAIGTMLGTGTVIGVGANVFGATRPPKFVSPFSWGGGADGGLVRREGFLTTAERVLLRRDVAFTEEVQRMLETVYDFATGS